MCVVWGAAMTFGLFASCVRAAPWIASSGVPWNLVRHFGLALVLASAEVACLVAGPLGAALSSVQWTLDGTSRTLSSLGVRPIRQALHFGAASIGFCAIVWLVSSTWGQMATDPGGFTNAMMEEAAQASCSQARAVDVPLVGVSWLCTSNTARLLGMPAAPDAAPYVFEASAVSFSRMLEAATLRHVRVALRSPKVLLEVEHAKVTGFAPWLGASSVDGWTRGVASAVASGLGAIFSGYAIIIFGLRSRAAAVVVGLVGPVAFIVLGIPTLASVPKLGFVVLVLQSVLLPILSAWLCASRALLGLSRGAMRRVRREHAARIAFHG